MQSIDRDEACVCVVSNILHECFVVDTPADGAGRDGWVIVLHRCMRACPCLCACATTVPLCPINYTRLHSYILFLILMFF